MYESLWLCDLVASLPFPLLFITVLFREHLSACHSKLVFLLMDDIWRPVNCWYYLSSLNDWELFWQIIVINIILIIYPT